MVAGQKIALGRTYAHQVLTVHVAATTVTIDLDGDHRTVTRATTQPVRRIKAHRPRTTHFSQADCQPCPETNLSKIYRD